MNKSIFNLMQKVTEEKLDPRLQSYASKNGITIGDGDGQVTREQLVEQIKEAEDFLLAQFSRKDFSGNEYDVPTLNMNEALNSSDASILFPRVISNVLQEPKEPNLFLQNVVAEVVELADNTPLLVEFPTVSAIQAFEMSEGQEYTNQQIAVGQGMTSIRIKKIGVTMAVNEEVLIHSMWPLLQMYLRMMSAAIDRKVESILFNAMTARAQEVFNNNNTDSQYRTSGVASNQTWNATFSYNDLVKLCGTLLGNRYEATHFLAHPLAWPIFATDPILRAQFYHAGQLGAGIWTRMPQFDQASNFPFGISYVPYYAIPYNDNETLTGAGSSLAAGLVSDVYLIDAKNSLFLAQRGKTDMDQMQNWFRDATQVKARKYAGVSVKDAGKGMVAAKKIRIQQNYEAIMTVRTIAS